MRQDGRTPMTNLHVSAVRYAEIQAKLLEAYPGLADDERALHDTLSGETDLPDLINFMVESIQEDEHLAAALGERIAQLTQRATRLEHRAEKKREAILNAMMEAGIQRLQLPSVTLSQAVNPASVVVVEAARIPADYWIQQKPPDPKLDKRGILRDLKEGMEVPGATLSNQTTRLNWRSN